MQKRFNKRKLANSVFIKKWEDEGYMHDRIWTDTLVELGQH